MDQDRFAIMTRSLTRIPSRREVVRGLLGAGIGVGILSLAPTTEAKKKRKKRKKQAGDQVPPSPPPPPPPPPPPVCSQLGGVCTPGQSLCCGELLCIEVPQKMVEPVVPKFTCCKKQGASCSGADGECCTGLLLTCTAGVCQPGLKG